MYGVTDLYGLSEKPLRGKISLKLLLDYYQIYLAPFNFRYHLPDGNVIDLRFQKKRLCHLIGIETIAKERYTNDSMLKRYKGDRGFNRIENGEIDFTHLRSISTPVTNNLKDKTIFFYQIPHIIMSPEAIFRYKKVSGSNIQCEILFYDLMHGVCAHLGIEIDDSGKFYYPRTFFIEKNNGQKFVQEQDDEIMLERIEQINLSNDAVIKSIDFKTEDVSE